MNEQGHWITDPVPDRVAPRLRRARSARPLPPPRPRGRPSWPRASPASRGSRSTGCWRGCAPRSPSPAACVWLWTVTTVVTAGAARARPPGRSPESRHPCGGSCWWRAASPSPEASPGRPWPPPGQACTRTAPEPRGAALVQGLPLPDRATGALPGGARTSHQGRLPVSRVVIVRPGDTLWALAGQGPAWHRLTRSTATSSGPTPT